MRRVVVSGIGIVAPNGADTGSFWKNCLAGAASVAGIPEEWTAYHSYSSRMWAPLPTVDFSRHHINRVEVMQSDMTALLAIVAADQALSMSCVDLISKNAKKNTFTLDGLDSLRCGVFVGTGVGGITSFAANEGNHLFSPAREFFSDPSFFSAEKREQLDRIVRCPPRFHPFVVAMTMPNTAAASLGIKYSLNGPNSTFCNACAAGTTAIGKAFRAIRGNELDWALAGGVDYLHDDYGGIFRGFDVAGTLISNSRDPQDNRPFDASRNGFLMAEGGCAILVLESLEHAQRRHAIVPVAEILGFAETFDATSIMSPDPSGAQAERMIHSALADAGLSARDIDYINSHGTGTKANDEVEAAVIERIFADRPLVNATKSLTGHAIGASGAIEAAVTALSLLDQTTHACKNLRQPIRPLNFVREARPYSIDTALTQSFAFGGHNAALVMSRLR
jgi:3-oxoacyl-[acyl-carrier-protein] synthase II